MKWSCCLFLLVLTLGVNAQENEQLFSLDVKNQTIESVFKNIEEQSDYTFYYAKEWLSHEPITTSFQNTSLDTILNELLKSTSLNFFIDSDKRIVLTRNNLIYDILPADYFGVKDSIVQTQENLLSPVFIKDQPKSTQGRVSTIRIGKESKNQVQKIFKLTGQVINAKTGNPIPNLTLTVQNSSVGTSTDTNGRYELILPAGLNSITTSAVGIEQQIKNVIIYNDGELNFNLEENFEELKEVIVQADASKNVDDANTGNARIGSEETKNIPLVLGERDILKVATTLPGVSTAGEGASGYNVRGGKTDQNLILLDHAVIYNPSHFFGIFPALNPATIREVNIYKGNIPAEYGGRLSSVFDIRTKKADNEKLGLEASIGPVTASAAIEIPVIKGKAGLMLGGRAAYSDWVLKALDEENLKNSQASFYDIILKYNHTIDDKNEFNTMGYFSKDAFSITSDSLYNYHNRLFSADWTHKLNDRKALKVILANSQYKFNIDYDGGSTTNFLQSFQVDETELKLNLAHSVDESHQLNYGVAAKLYTVQPGSIEPKTSGGLIKEFSVPTEKALETALFISDAYELNEKLLLNLGLRYSYYMALGSSSERIYQDGISRTDASVIDTIQFGNNEVIKTYGGPELRVSARYLIQEDLSIKASFNNTYQFIHTLSNNTTVSPIDTWKLSDYYIEPQRATQFSLGLYKNLNGNAFEFSLEGFYKRQHNTLDFKTGATLLLNENIESEVLQGEGKAYGVELLIKKNEGKLNGWLSYTYARSLFKLDSEFDIERVNDGRYFPSNYDKPHDLSLILNYKITNRISFSGNFIYQTGRPVTFPIGNYQFNGSEYVLYSDRNQFRIPDYYRLDLGVNIEGNHKKNKLAHSYWSVSVYNVMGRNNPYSVFFVNKEGEIKGLKSSIFGIPIPSITYNIKF